MVPDPETTSRKKLNKNKSIVKNEHEEYTRGEYYSTTGDPSFFTEFMVTIQYSVMVLAAIFNEILRNLKILKTYYPQEREQQSVILYFLACIIDYVFRILWNLKTGWKPFISTKSIV